MPRGGQLTLKATSRLGLTFVLLTVVTALACAPAWSFSEKRLTARAAFLVNAETGEILYQRRPDRELPPASTTKVLTALVALNHAKLNDRFAASEAASQVTSLKLGLQPGQTMSVEDLLYSALLYSANDAAMVLAEGVGHSVDGFAEMMTHRAREMGAQNSQFKNPHGLTEVGHYTTARDLALIFTHAMQNGSFRTIVHTKWKWVDLISASHPEHVKKLPVRNKNRLLWSFNGALGGKTGYTRAARRCFVGAASRHGVTLVVSILGSNSLWRDARSLLEFGFSHYAPIQVTENSSDAPAKLTDSDEEYLIQVGSFQDEDRAESVRQNISKGGFDVFVQKASLAEGPTAYRVRVGPYSEWSQAKAAARELERKRGLNTVIFQAVTSPEPPPATPKIPFPDDVWSGKKHLFQD